MTGYTRIIIAVMTTVLLLSAPAGAQRIIADLGAGPHSVQADIQVETTMDMATVYAGGGIRYEEDDYTLFHLKSGLKQSVFAPALTFGLGFTGVGGKYEILNHRYDLAAIGFTVMGRCDLARTAAAVPLTLYSEVTASPSPLCFSDSTRYKEFTAGMEVNIIENGAIFIQYNYIKAEFENIQPVKTEDSKDSLRLGFRLNFGY